MKIKWNKVDQNLGLVIRGMIAICLFMAIASGFMFGIVYIILSGTMIHQACLLGVCHRPILIGLGWAILSGCYLFTTCETFLYWMNRQPEETE